MPDAAGIDRIAAAMNAIRPDWRIPSLRTFLTTHHSARPYRDLAIAAIAIATDPKTTTPQLLNQHGSWWVAAQVASGATAPIHFTRCPEPGHGSYPSSNCGACRSEALEATEQARALVHVGVPPERVKEILAGAHTPDVRRLAAGEKD